MRESYTLTKLFLIRSRRCSFFAYHRRLLYEESIKGGAEPSELVSHEANIDFSLLASPLLRHCVEWGDAEIVNRNLNLFIAAINNKGRCETDGIQIVVLALSEAMPGGLLE